MVHMTHLSEERDIHASPAAIWAVIADTTRWPQFFATPREIGKLDAVEYLGDATHDGPDVVRRMSFTMLPAWDEQIARWRPDESVQWLGVRNPWQKYWTQQMEIIPGRGFTTLRWDVFYELLGVPRPARKLYRTTLEDTLFASLERIERLAMHEEKLA